MNIPPPMPKSPRDVIVTTGNDVSGHRITGYIGIVRGLVVRTTDIFSGFIGGLKSIGGGNISEYTRVCETARLHAYDIMVQHAAAVGADAIIAMRYDATEFRQNATEVLAYGTAVTLEKA